MSIETEAHELLRLMEIWCSTGKGDFSLTQKLHAATRDLKEAFIAAKTEQPVGLSDEVDDLRNYIMPLLASLVGKEMDAIHLKKQSGFECNPMAHKLAQSIMARKKPDQGVAQPDAAAIRMIDSRFCEAYSDAVLLFDGKRGEIEAMHDGFADLLRLCRASRPARESGRPDIPDITSSRGCHSSNCDLQKNLLSGCSCGHWRDKQGRPLRWEGVLRDKTDSMGDK